MVATRGRHVRTLALILPGRLRSLRLVTGARSRRDGRHIETRSILSVRARQLTGRSRVIVEFNGAPDVRAITGRMGWPRG